jgi:integrase
MARTAEGWALVRSGRPENKIWFVRFTHRGYRVKRSTGEAEIGRAKEAAARIYADVLCGRQDETGTRSSASVEPLDVLFAHWLVCLESALDETTVDQYGMYARRFITFFRTLDRISKSSAADYARARLREVRRKTVLKELSALRGFLAWCVEKGLLRGLPLIVSPTRNSVGRPDPRGRFKGDHVDLCEAEIEAVIAALPQRSRRGHAARAFFRVLWETGLRPSTVAALRAPEDYRKGNSFLMIRDEIDKNRFGRKLPLSPAAREALDQVCPDVGLLFGAHRLRETLRAAARRANLADDKAERVTNYDFRHARLTFMASTTPDLAGIAYLAGHRHVSTTALYVHGRLKAAENVLASILRASRSANEAGTK